MNYLGLHDLTLPGGPLKINLEKYDKYVRRINGTLLLLACLGAILVCTIVGYKLLSEVFGERQVHEIVNVDQNSKKEEFLRVGYFQTLKGTEYILVPLTLEQKIDSSYYLKSAHNRAKNYLVFNTLNKESYWIWKNNSNLVLEHTQIYNQSQDEKNKKTKGLVFEFVEKDSNSDSLLTDNDLKSVFFFEFILGHFVFKFSWKWLLNDFNVLRGRLLLFGMIFLFFAPFIVGRIKGII